MPAVSHFFAAQYYQPDHSGQSQDETEYISNNYESVET